MAISTRDTGVDEGHGDPFVEPAEAKRSRFSRKPKKSSRDDSGWLDDVEEVPRSDLPDGRRVARRARWTKWYLIACAVLAPFLLVGSLVAATKPMPEIPEQKPRAAMSRVQAEAMVSIQNWIATGKAPVSNARVLGWQSTDRLPRAKVDPNQVQAEDEEPVTLSAVKFLIATAPKEGPDGEVVGVDSEYASTLYSAEVLVATTESGAVSVIGEPALMPTTPAMAQSVEQADRWPSLPEATTPSEQAEASITSWAEALTSGSPQELRAAVNDSESDRAYIPFVDVRLRNVTIGSGAIRKTVGEEDPVPTEIVVAVTLEMADRKPCDECESTVAEYDVLIVGANTVTPRVVAWGAPGTGPTLKPYQNAVPSNEVLNGALSDMEGESAEQPDQPDPGVASSRDSSSGSSNDSKKSTDKKAHGKKGGPKQPSPQGRKKSGKGD